MLPGSRRSYFRLAALLGTKKGPWPLRMAVLASPPSIAFIPQPEKSPLHCYHTIITGFSLYWLRSRA
jgi:hypothetical protein